MQGAYNAEAMGMESLKMENFFRCKWRTNLHGPSNVAVHCSAQQCCQWKFAYIREYAYTGTKVVLMKGAYNPEAMGMESLKIEIILRCKRRTKLYEPSNILRPLQRPIVPSMKIRVHSRGCLARYKGCTNARCI